MHSFLLTCPLGLEAFCKKDVEKQWFTLREVQDKAIYFTGEIEAIARMNLWSRFGNILYYIVAEQKKVIDFDTYFDWVFAQEWSKYIPEGYEIIVNATSLKSELGATPALQRLAKKAIVKKILTPPARWGSLPPQSRGIEGEFLREDPKIGTIEIRILIENNTLRILLNTSGQGLHKRWYREMTGDAPLKENIAAALVIISQWRFKEPLYDIFCGGGTILIEAAMIARNIAPGLQRKFAFESWNWIPRGLLESEKECAKTKEFSWEYQIYGSDIRKDVIQLAERNAHFAGVGDTIKFNAQDYTSYLRREITWTLISNPPYGLRLENADVPQIHKDIAELLQKNKNLGGGIITAHADFETYSKLKYKKRKLYNGWELCYFYKKEI